MYVTYSVNSVHVICLTQFRTVRFSLFLANCMFSRVLRIQFFSDSKLERLTFVIKDDFYRIWESGDLNFITFLSILCIPFLIYSIAKCCLLDYFLMLRHAAFPDNYRTKHFRRWNVSDDMCTIDRWSFWSWFDVNRSIFDEDMHEKRSLHLCSQWPWPSDP